MVLALGGVLLGNVLFIVFGIIAILTLVASTVYSPAYARPREPASASAAWATAMSLIVVGIGLGAFAAALLLGSLPAENMATRLIAGTTILVPAAFFFFLGYGIARVLMTGERVLTIRLIQRVSRLLLSEIRPRR